MSETFKEGSYKYTQHLYMKKQELKIIIIKSWMSYKKFSSIILFSNVFLITVFQKILFDVHEEEIKALNSKIPDLRGSTALTDSSFRLFPTLIRCSFICNSIACIMLFDMNSEYCEAALASFQASCM